MDTHTLFSYAPDHFIANLVMWASLVFMTILVFYWAGTIENDIENNPENSRLSKED